jgi:uncharacterized membrane protein (UPF0127 family)
MSKQKVNIQYHEKIIVADVTVANNFWTRLSGYMFRKSPHVPGILFESSGGIQTTFMNFGLDVVFLTKEDQVAKVRRNVNPWKLVWSSSKSCKVLELPAGHLPSEVMIGDMLSVAAVGR